MKLDALLQRARSSLGTAPGLPANEARQEAVLLLRHVLGVSHTWLISHGKDDVSPHVVHRVQAALEERARGRPLAYILGEWAFHELSLVVTDAVLVPRPDTETLVELAANLVPLDDAWRILDLGTGSGAVALALARLRPQSLVLALDKSADALEVARQNARRNTIENVRFLEGDWMHGLHGRFDLIVSNPPYLPEKDPHLTRNGLSFEPTMALVSGSDGLDAIRTIVQQAPDHLVAGGHLLLEHGFDQATKVQGILKAAGFQEIVTHQDLPGHDRVTGGKWP